ncbi:MAG: hypothetical protein WC412_02070 [Candidatus Omnitrophota bacterium]|jgi:hypothetical protein
MKFSGKQIIKLLMTILFFACMLYANFYAVRRMSSYGMELYFYDKLAVAHDIGGQYGMRQELKNIITSEKFPKELALAKAFEGHLQNLKDPAAYVDAKVKHSKTRLLFIRNLRTTAIVLMFLLFIWRMVVNFSTRFKQKTKAIS